MNGYQIARIIGIIIGLTCFGALLLYDWRVAVCVFAMMWADNVVKYAEAKLKE